MAIALSECQEAFGPQHQEYTFVLGEIRSRVPLFFQCANNYFIKKLIFADKRKNNKYGVTLSELFLVSMVAFGNCTNLIKPQRHSSLKRSLNFLFLNK